MLSALRTLSLGLLLATVAALPVQAQSAETTSPAVDTSDAAPTPYATHRSLLYHVLAAPAYVLHAATRPLGWAVRYAEQVAPALFDRKLPPRGVLPLADFGGPTGFSGGLRLYDNRLFGTRQSARVQALYGGSNAFSISGQYEHPRAFGRHTRVRMRANLFSDPRDTFFRGGNDSDPDADRFLYERDQLDLSAALYYAPPNARLRARADLLYERVDTAPNTPGAPPAFASPGTVDLLTPGAALQLDVTDGRPRTHSGTEVVLAVNYAHDLASDRHRHARYAVELRQYVPVFLFPRSRRLALRARLEQVAPIFGGRRVPFYLLPSLGGQHSLRGFRHERFQDDGSLVLNLEYRYPIWENWDAVLFTDAGQVFDSVREVAVDRFRWSYGGGIHLLNDRGLTFRAEVAASSEGLRTILTLQPTFRRLAR